VWADEEDDRRSSKRSKERKSYTTPVAFVSGGIKVGDKVTKNADEEDLEITVWNQWNKFLYYYFTSRYNDIVSTEALKFLKMIAVY